MLYVSPPRSRCLLILPIAQRKHIGRCQCDQIGRFWNFLVAKFITKVAQMFDDFLGSCEKYQFLYQTGEFTFWATFGKTCANFYFNIWSHCSMPNNKSLRTEPNHEGL